MRKRNCRVEVCFTKDELSALSKKAKKAGMSIEEYNRIMKAADKVVYTSQDYYNGCMHKRNRHLVDNSSRCICFLTEKTGGTFYTVNYASEHGLMIINTAK